MLGQTALRVSPGGLHFFLQVVRFCCDLLSTLRTRAAPHFLLVSLSSVTVCVCLRSYLYDANLYGTIPDTIVSLSDTMVQLYVSLTFNANKLQPSDQSAECSARSQGREAAAATFVRLLPISRMVFWLCCCNLRGPSQQLHPREPTVRKHSFSFGQHGQHGRRPVRIRNTCDAKLLLLLADLLKSNAFLQKCVWQFTIGHHPPVVGKPSRSNSVVRAIHGVLHRATASCPPSLSDLLGAELSPCFYVLKPRDPVAFGLGCVGK